MTERSSTGLYFLHIPKTAGITVEQVIKRYFDEDEICPAYFPREYAETTPEQAAAYRLFVGHGDYETHAVMPPGTALVTVLRNPIAQLVSLYNHIMTRPKHHQHAEFNERDLTFAEFADLPQSRHALSRRIIGRSAFSERRAEAGRDGLVELALARIDEFAVVGLTERLPRFFADLSSLMGVEPITEWPHANVAHEKRITVDEVDDATRAKHRRRSPGDYAIYERVLERLDG
jgi:hypothetical protein